MRLPNLCRNSDGRAFSYYPGTGGRKRQYFGQYGTPEAEAAYRQWLQSILSGYQPPSGKNLRIVDLVEQFLAHCEKQHGKDTTEFNLIFKACERLLLMAADKPAQSIGPVLLGQYAERMLSETFRKRNGPVRTYSRTYISKCISRIKRMVKWASGKEILPPEHFHKLAAFDLASVVPQKARRRDPVTAIDFRIVRASLPFLSDPVRSMVPVQALCGMRPQDVCNLRPVDIDTSHTVWVYEPEGHKNTHRGQRLMKAIPPSAQVFLLPYLTCQPHQYVFRPELAPAFNLHQKVGERYTTGAYRTAILRGCERAQKAHVPIPLWTPNQLRHGAARLVRERMGYDAASQWLGHSTPDTTAIYAARSVKAVLEVASEMEEKEFGKIFRNPAE